MRIPFSENRQRQEAFLAAGGLVYKKEFFDLADKPQINALEGSA